MGRQGAFIESFGDGDSELREEQTLLALQELDKKERIFVLEYINAGFNARVACVRAGYSESSARVMGYNFLARPHVQAALDNFISARSVSAGLIIDRLLQIATGDMGDFLTYNPQNKRAHVDLGKAVREGNTAVIKKVRETSRSTEIELIDPMAALTLLARIKGMLDDRRTITVDWKQHAANAGADPEQLKAQVLEFIRKALPPPEAVANTTNAAVEADIIEMEE